MNRSNAVSLMRSYEVVFPLNRAQEIFKDAMRDADLKLFIVRKSAKSSSGKAEDRGEWSRAPSLAHSPFGGLFRKRTRFVVFGGPRTSLVVLVLLLTDRKDPTR